MLPRPLDIVKALYVHIRCRGLCLLRLTSWRRGREWLAHTAPSRPERCLVRAPRISSALSDHRRPRSRE